MASKRERIHEARQRLKTARDQWDRASVASWEPVEPAECVTNCFYALENAVTAAALASAYKVTTKHYETAELAARLFKEGKLKTDVSDRLNELNGVRKDVQYGQPGESLLNMNLDELVTEIEAFLNEVEKLVT